MQKGTTFKITRAIPEVRSKKKPSFPQRAEGKNPPPAPGIFVSQRIDIIYDLIQQGYRPSEMMRFVEQNRYIIDKETKLPKQPLEINHLFNFGETMLRHYINRANEKFEALRDDDRRRKTGIAEARYTYFIRLALQQKDIFNAINAQSKLDKIQGNEAPTETTINVRGKSLDELQSRLIAIFIKAGSSGNLTGDGETEESGEISEGSDSMDEIEEPQNLLVG